MVAIGFTYIIRPTEMCMISVIWSSQDPNREIGGSRFIINVFSMLL